MKPIKTKATKDVRLFKMMDITEKQFKQAKAWYQSATRGSEVNVINSNKV